MRVHDSQACRKMGVTRERISLKCVCVLKVFTVGTYDQLQDVNDQTPQKDIAVVLGDWNTKVGKDAHENWRGMCGYFCNGETNERGLSLPEFATFNNCVLMNTFGHHKAPRRWTKWKRPKFSSLTSKS